MERAQRPSSMLGMRSAANAGGLISFLNSEPRFKLEACWGLKFAGMDQVVGDVRARRYIKDV